MPNIRLVLAIVAAGVIAAGISTGTAWAGGPGGVIEDPNDMSVAVGSGVFEGQVVGGADYLMGFRALGETNDEASAAVIAACQAAGGVECTADEVTNDDLCHTPLTCDVSYRLKQLLPVVVDNWIDWNRHTKITIGKAQANALATVINAQNIHVKFKGTGIQPPGEINPWAIDTLTAIQPRQP